MRSSTRFIDRRNMRSPISFNDFQQPLFESLPPYVSYTVDRNKDACIHIYFIHVRARLQGLTLTCLILSLNIALRNHKIRNHKILLERAEEARRVGRVQGRESGKGEPNRSAKKKSVEQLSRVHGRACARKCVH